MRNDPRATIAPTTAITQSVGGIVSPDPALYGNPSCAHSMKIHTSVKERTIALVGRPFLGVLANYNRSEESQSPSNIPACVIDKTKETLTGRTKNRILCRRLSVMPHSTKSGTGIQLVTSVHLQLFASAKQRQQMPRNLTEDVCMTLDIL